MPQIISWQARQGLGMEVSNGGKATLVQSGGSRKDTKGCQRDGGRGSDHAGFDASRCEYVDLVEAGIIDPTKVARMALENAVSVASVLLLAEATLTEIPEEKKKAAAAQESFD